MTDSIPRKCEDREPALATFPGLIRAAAAAYGEETALTLEGDGIEAEAISFAGLERKSAELARSLLAHGVGKGSRIGFILGNGPMFAVTFAALARIGAIAIPISTMVKGSELVRVLRQSDVQGLFVQRRLLGHDLIARLLDALPEIGTAPDAGLRLPQVPYLRWIVSTGEGLPCALRPMDWLDTGASGVSEELLLEAEACVHPTDQIVEIYTSGSMALPKGVKHLHGPVMYRTGYLARMTNRHRGEQHITQLPMFWVGGLGMSLLPSLAAGACAVCTESTLLSSRFAMGSVMAAEDLAMVAKNRPWWGLGMSETFGPYTFGNEPRAKGYPLCAPLDNIADLYEVRVVDSGLKPVGQGETGEIQVRGYALTPGLHKLDRADYFTPDGFYRTGDLGLREGARIHFVGRDGDMIKTAGSNVSPAEVEQELQSLEGIHSAYVLGLPHVERGQLVVAAVVARDGFKPDFAAIEAELRGRLSSYKVPRAWFELAREDVPLLPSNKVARRVLADMLAGRVAHRLSG